ncbi:TetR/AcrR family transcriptional regulator [Nocardia cyriacigeorgica]|uniref:TetR/AcrR family transcriptional regulator n=1 Tax=Nocardia cyriacigeorgica TaxID=135487 RepID=UPI00189453EB|nr:TetR/AcrR family transcriptional regulator [Nocardia cyriacigeorgica]MBF6101508.1 TetR/AcrR family transcriptional regulator [Nocardia cyriacigeorgica]MBF6320474.1 TetR/AcrR family transcriptional regulator [Nocardia cyriacigeorgica]MBF6346253.1 TetR/AcrR family transcriptional regulator [Nocardia cyriacigeorgica]MBF6518101.1 TetR/AcrR family transcriptional regulator [Nocardia cyriacigeorgica]MBF6534961.1 TetR/AcrR family transcriptional regulator [Nocardia cyriacigeorgica]
MVSQRAEVGGGRWGDHNSERRRAIMEALIALIEESEPGAEIPLQLIAERAGIRRSVVYRHFADRQDLDDKTREYVVESSIDQVMPTLDLDDSLHQTLFRIIDTYVRLVAARPRLHLWVEQGPGSHDPAGIAVVGGTKLAVSQRITDLFTMATTLLGIEEPGLEVAAFSVVSMVDGAVTRWLQTEPPGVDAAEVTRLLTESLWYLIDGHARARGVSVDPHRPLRELLTLAADA